MTKAGDLFRRADAFAAKGLATWRARRGLSPAPSVATVAAGPVKESHPRAVKVPNKNKSGGRVAVKKKGSKAHERSR